MSMWEELQRHVNLVQQIAPHLGVWSGCVLAFLVLGGSMNQIHHCHVWVSYGEAVIENLSCNLSYGRLCTLCVFSLL